MGSIRFLTEAVLLTFFAFLVHVFIVPYLSILHVVPDVLLVLVVYFAIREGQLAATVAGFLIGFALDMSGGEQSMTGLSALTKTVAGFLAGYFYHETRVYQTLGSSRFLLVVAVASLVHNVIFFVIYLQGTEIGVADALVFHALPTTLYTVLVTLLPMFHFARKQGS
jgi:rod shape-determining protein MreD